MVMICATLMPMEKPNVSLMTERSSTNGLSALKPMELDYASQLRNGILAHRLASIPPSTIPARIKKIKSRLRLSFMVPPPFHCRPVEPKPPVPRSVSVSVSTSSMSGKATGITASWAMRSPFCTV